jgi:hypothetical protein
MTQIKVVILEGGKTAREINPIDKPIFNYEFGPDGPTDSQLQSADLDCDKRFSEWQAAEVSLRTFEIENYFKPIADDRCLIFHSNKDWQDVYKSIYVGKEYLGEIMDEGRVRIL